MKIWRVTFTGADDDTSIGEMVKLSHQYKHLEWGILFSQSKSGVARYPSPQWVDRLPTGLNLSAHLCGKWVEDALNGDMSFNDARFSRIQLNCGKSRLRTALTSQKLVETCARAFERDRCLALGSIILGGDYEGVSGVSSSKFEFLFDASGGTGESPKTWMPLFSSESCGFAGGLNPDNLYEELQKMSAVAEDRHIWIDMETGVRSEDKFDLNKVEQCLKIVEPWLL